MKYLEFFSKFDNFLFPYMEKKNSILLLFAHQQGAIGYFESILSCNFNWPCQKQVKFEDVVP